jgi:hypothetical protein
MNRATKLKAPMNASRNVMDYALTKAQRDLFDRAREMIAWRKSRTPLLNVTLTKSDWEDINSRVVEQSHGRLTLNDLTFDGLKVGHP